VRAGLDELGADLQCVDKAGAGGGEVEAPGAGCADLFLHEAGSGGEEHIRRDGGDEDGLDLGGVNAAAAQAVARGLGGEVAGGYALVHDVALMDAGALDDPLVVGGDHLLEVGVGEKAGRNVSSYRRDLGADAVPGLQLQTQTSDLPGQRATVSILSRLVI